MHNSIQNRNSKNYPASVASVDTQMGRAYSWTCQTKLLAYLTQ